MITDKGGSIEILLIEDNPADARLMEVIFKDCKRSIGLSIARDGAEAMDLLRKKGKYANARWPDLILLDLNLPNKDGREVLAEIKGDPELKHIPVAILTASEAEDDILHSYQMHANCYLSKPVDLNKFKEMVRSIVEFWFEIAKLPPRDEISEREPD